MKKTILTIFSLVLTAHFVFGGGIVTNTNQSAAWVRSMARDASVDVDAVFFNPAGLTHLEDGFYIQVNTQTVWQSRTVTSDFPGLNTDTYEGSTFVPLLPTGFLAYKKGNLAVSAGFTVIGGGGSAVYDSGLPFFEYDLVGAMPTIGVNQYSAEINFEGSSAYYGFQAGVSYKINDVISVGLGARYIMANNTYGGAIKNISYNFLGGPITNANQFFTGSAAALQPGVDGSGLIVAGGGGGFTLDELFQFGIIDEATKAALEGGLLQLGIPAETIALMDANTINETFVQYQNTFVGAAAQFSDKEVDVTQSGSGITPIVSVDLSFMEGDLGLALKYEHKTAMKVTTEVIKDNSGAGLFIDGEEVTANLPGMISVGLRYKAMEKFRVQAGFHYYLDMGASYGKKADGAGTGEFINNGEEATIAGQTTTYLAGNSYEAALGLEFDVIDMLTLSAGYLYTASNPNEVYQSGLGYTLNTGTFGAGVALHILDNFDLDLAFSTTTYDVRERDFGSFKETYDKTASVFAAGLTYKF